MNTFAVYLSHAWEVNEHFVITDGIRYTNTSLKANFQDTTFFKFPFKTAKQNLWKTLEKSEKCEEVLM